MNRVASQFFRDFFENSNIFLAAFWRFSLTSTIRVPFLIDLIFHSKLLEHVVDRKIFFWKKKKKKNRSSFLKLMAPPLRVHNECAGLPRYGTVYAFFTDKTMTRQWYNSVSCCKFHECLLFFGLSFLAVGFATELYLCIFKVYWTS